MANFNNIPIGFKITTQLPLDAKEFVLNETLLSSLGTNNQLAYTYYDSLKVFCQEERTYYEWREVGLGEENTGLIPADFTYPAGIIYQEIDYSGRTFNFFKVEPGTDTIIQEGTNITITGTGSEEDPYIINSTYTYTPSTPDIPPFLKLNEGAGYGIVIRSSDRTKFGNIGQHAFDISVSEEDNGNFGAIGDYSFCGGYQSTALGIGSFVFGDEIMSSAYGSTSIGYKINNGAIGGFSTGYNMYNGGYTNFVTGIGHSVTSMNVTVVGQAANIISEQILDFNITTTKKLFVVGNGTIENNNANFPVLTRSDAFVVRQNGYVEAPSLSIQDITDELTGKILITREYLTGETDALTAVDIDIQNQIDDIVVDLGAAQTEIDAINNTLGYKSYVALLSQSALLDPVISGGTPLVDTLGGTGSVTIVRTGVGEYEIRKTGAFPVHKTVCFISVLGTTTEAAHMYRYDNDTVRLNTSLAGALADTVLGFSGYVSSVEIRVYN